MQGGAMQQNAMAQWLTSGGDLGSLMHGKDWRATPLGPVEQWPAVLWSTLNICLSARFPMAIYWGQEGFLLYNDAWRPILGNKHPWAMGRSAVEVWPEIWDAIGPVFDTVRTTGKATWHGDALLPMQRFGYTEECYFDYTFNPIHGESGKVEGILNVVQETTYRVLNDRRTRLLRELAATSGSAKTETDACRMAISAIATDTADIPFAMLYLVDADRRLARLTQAAGLPSDSPAIQNTVDLAADTGRRGWPLAAALQGHSITVDDVPERFGALPGGPWPEPATQALVLPLAAAGQAGIAAILVAGVSPRRPLDGDYRRFFDMVASHIATAIVNAAAYSTEKQRAEAFAELDRVKTVFFSNVSHEFRTPLTLMLGPVEDVLAKGGAGLSPFTRHQLEVASRNGQRLLRLVNMLLDFARLEAGRMHAVFEPTDLGAFTAELAGVFRSATEAAGLRLLVDCPPLPEPVFVDRNMWENIILNLLSNAFKFTFEGEIEVSVRYEPLTLALSPQGRGDTFLASERSEDGSHSLEKWDGPLALASQGKGDSSPALERSEDGSLVPTSEKEADPLPLAPEGRGNTAPSPERSEDGLLAHSSEKGGDPLALAPVGRGKCEGREMGEGREAGEGKETDEENTHGAGAVVLSVRDTGVGIPAEEMPRLFERFHRVQNVPSRTHEGSGIGLALVQELVKLHGGSVRAESRHGEGARLGGARTEGDNRHGTTFIVTVPLGTKHLPPERIGHRSHDSTARRAGPFVEEALRWLPAEAEEGSRYDVRGSTFGIGDSDSSLSQTANAERRTSNPSPGHILVADDNADMREYVTRLLAERFHVEAVADGEGALAAVRAQTPDLILSDVMMPRMDGCALLRALRNDPATASIPVILLSARAGEESRIEGLERGADDYLIKPFSGRELLARVGAHMEMARVRKEALARERELLNEATLLNQKLEHQQEQLVQSAKLASIGELSAGIAHELNNPLNNIGLFVGNVIDQLQAAEIDRAKALQHLEATVHQVRRAAAIINHLRAFARASPATHERVSINRVIRSAVLLVEDQLRLRNVDVAMQLAADEPEIVGNAIQLEQVMINLLSNARDAVEPAARKRIVLTSGVRDTSVDVTVSDTGAGIPAEIQSRIFDPFFTTKDVGKGTGLGLSISYGIIKDHGGTIVVESEAGQGTTFVVRLPVATE
jgi:signal transduction histidine kinase